MNGVQPRVVVKGTKLTPTFISREWNDQRVEDEFDGLHNLVLPTAAQPMRKQLSGKMLTIRKVADGFG